MMMILDLSELYWMCPGTSSRRHCTHGYYVPPFFTRDSLTFDIVIAPYTLTFVYTLFYNLLYRLLVDWEMLVAPTPLLSGHHQTNNQARAAPLLELCEGDLQKDT